MYLCICISHIYRTIWISKLNFGRKQLSSYLNVSNHWKVYSRNIFSNLQNKLAYIHLLIFTPSLGAASKKKTCTFGWSRPQNGDPPPLPQLWSKYKFFLSKFFFMPTIPWNEKKIDQTWKWNFYPPPSQPQLCQIFPLDESN